MKRKTIISVVMIYAVITAIFIILLGGAAVEAREHALTPFQLLTLKSQSRVIEEAIMPKAPQSLRKSKNNRIYTVAALCAGGVTLGIPLTALLLAKKEDD